jgi:hypothetical protein
VILTELQKSLIMEVHHHTHTARKKWTHYFWEFLMLFLAVTLGFLVENEREHYIEHLRARQYALSLADDLEKDTAAFRRLGVLYALNVKKVDTLNFLLKKKSWQNLPGGTLYYYADVVRWVNIMTFHDATIQQLKNSGNLRYFPTQLQHKISEYDRRSREISVRQENELYFSRIAREMTYGILDAEQVIAVKDLSTPEEIESYKQKNIPLLTRDTLALRKFLNEIIYRAEAWGHREQEIITPAYDAAVELLASIKKEYHLD